MECPPSSLLRRGIFDSFDEEVNATLASPCLSAFAPPSSLPFKPSSSSATLDSQNDGQPVTCSRNVWNTLRDHCVEICRSDERVNALRHQLSQNSVLQSQLNNREMASVRQNQEIANARLRERVSTMKKKLVNRRLGRCDVLLLHEEKEQWAAELIVEQDELKTQLQQKQRILGERDPLLVVFRELLIHRRRMMLSELLRTFRLQVGRSPETTCKCPERDFVCGVHVPATTNMTGHDDPSLTAGFGLLVQLLNAISFICDYPFRYPMFLSTTSCTISLPFSGTILPLLSLSRGRKSERARLDEAVSLLSRNIAQLRSDLGLEEESTGRNVATLQNILTLLTSRRPCMKSTLLPRPWESSLSVASLVERSHSPVEMERTGSPSSLFSLRLSLHCPHSNTSDSIENSDDVDFSGVDASTLP